MGESRPEYTEDLRRAVFALRAQGLSFLEVCAQIKQDFNGLVLPPRTAQNWCLSAKDLIAQLRDRVIAQATERAQAVTPALFDRIEDAARDNDAKAADAWSRAITNLTRHLVGERIEVSNQAPESPDELAALLMRHGVTLEQRGNGSAAGGDGLI